MWNLWLLHSYHEFRNALKYKYTKHVHFVKFACNCTRTSQMIVCQPTVTQTCGRRGTKSHADRLMDSDSHGSTPHSNQSPPASSISVQCARLTRVFLAIYIPFGYLANASQDISSFTPHSLTFPRILLCLFSQHTIQKGTWSLSNFSSASTDEQTMPSSYILNVRL